MTLCNMVVEAGGKNGHIPADSTTYKYLEVSGIDHRMHLVSIVLYVTCVCTCSHMYVLAMHVFAHVYVNMRVINHEPVFETYLCLCGVGLPPDEKLIASRRAFF